jgi:large subunit ribosomal protein L41e
MRDKWRKKRVRRLKRKRRKMRARSKVRLPAVVHSEPIPRRTHVPVLPPAVNDSRRYLLATRSTTTPRCDLPLAGPRDPPSTTKCTARSTTLDELPIPPNIRSSASTFDQRQYPVPRTSGRSGDRQLGGKEVVHGLDGDEAHWTGRCRLSDELQGRIRFTNPINAPFLELEREIPAPRMFLILRVGGTPGHSRVPAHEDACPRMSRQSGASDEARSGHMSDSSALMKLEEKRGPVGQVDTRPSSCALTPCGKAREPLRGMEECNCDRTERMVTRTKEGGED